MEAAALMVFLLCLNAIRPIRARKGNFTNGFCMFLPDRVRLTGFLFAVFAPVNLFLLVGKYENVG